MAQTENFAPAPSTGRLMAALLVGGITPVLDTTLVALGLHTMVTELHSTVTTVQWVTTGYLLALAIAIPFVAWAQQRWGGKRVWIVALAVFTIGSALCACAWNALALIVFRIIQGFGGGIMFPLMQTLAMQKVAPAARTRTMATIGLPVALGPVLGPVLAGFLLNWASWHWLFLINVPIGITGLILAARFLADDRPAAAASRTCLDLVGVVFLAPGLAGLLYGLSNSHSDGGFARDDVLIPLVVGIALLTGFVVRTLRRTHDPLVDLRLLRVRSMRVASTALTFVGSVLFAGNFLLPLWFQAERGSTPLEAALLLIPQGVGTFVVRLFVARLVERFGPRAVAVGGSLLMAITTVPFALAGPDTSLWLLGAALLLRGIGNGLVLIPIMTGAYDDLAPEQMPHASAITRIVQQLGGAFGTALVATVLAAPAGTGGGFNPAFWSLTIATIAAATSALFIRTPVAVP